MIWSVSTLPRRSGTPTPVCWLNFSMVVLSSGGGGSSGLQVGQRRAVGRDDVRPEVRDRRQRPADRGRGCDERRHEVRAPALALAALEVAVGRRRAALPRCELVRVHAQAHRAAGVAPLRTEVEEDLVEPLGLGLQADPGRRRHDEDAHRLRLGASLDELGDRAKVLDPTVGARADEDRVDRDVTQRRSRGQAHVLDRTLGGLTLVLVGDLGRDGHAAGQRQALSRVGAPRDERLEVRGVQHDLEPFVTWGTNPGQGLPLSGRVPVPAEIADENERQSAERAIEYMGLTPGAPLRDIAVDTVFIGSCTNGRIEDLRSVAKLVKGRTKAESVRVLVVPASARVRLQAEAEGLDKIFLDFGAEWRNAGCSMCLGMNPDQLAPGERSASTSNRNFEGRQGKGGRTHLVSPLVAAATAIRGTLSGPADL